jgi:hypothetical protein
VTERNEPAPWSSNACRWLAGADAGVGAGLVALLWLAVHSRLTGQYWWAKFNVAAAPFYGDRVFSAGYGAATITGAACLLLGFALTGALVGRFTPAPPHWRRSLTSSMLASLALFLLAHRFLWPAVHPFARAYFTPLSTLPAHLLFALLMVRLGRRYLALMVAFGGLPWPPPVPAFEPPPGQPEPEPEPAPEPVEAGVQGNESAVTASLSEELSEETSDPAGSPIVEQVQDPLK